MKEEHDTQVTSLRAELESNQQELEGAQKKVRQLQAQLDQLRGQLQGAGAQPQLKTSPTASGSSATESPKTANIRPMTAPTSTTQVRPQQSQSVQPVRNAPTETRAMASIRPISVSQALPVVSTATATPTATVHPSLQEVDAAGQVPTSQPLLVATQQQVRPTQPVQAVSPHVDDVREGTTSSSEDSSVAQQEATSTSPAASAPVVVTSSAANTSAISAPSTSSGGVFVSAQALKRQRDADASDDAMLEDDASEAVADDAQEMPTKRSKMSVGWSFSLSATSIISFLIQHLQVVFKHGHVCNVCLFAGNCKSSSTGSEPVRRATAARRRFSTGNDDVRRTGASAARRDTG